MTVEVAQHPIAARREALGLSQVACAEQAGMTREALGRLERGESSRTRGPQRRTIVALAAVLGVSPEVLGAEVRAWIERRA